MFDNFLQAKKYFQNLRFGDFLSALVKKFDFGNFDWEHGFFSLFLTTDTTAPKLRQALTYAGVSVNSQSTIYEQWESGYLSRSIEKYISPEFALVIARHAGLDLSHFDIFNPLNVDDPVSFEDAFRTILKSFDARFGKSILKISEAYFNSEYDPIENYKMEQEETPDITREISRDKSATAGEDSSESGSNKEKTKVTNTTNKSESVYGFNSPDPVPATEGDSESTTEGADADNASEYDRNHKTESENTETESVTETESGSRKLTRRGNIGVTTSQQMLESELKLRRYDFMQYVYKCMDEMLTCTCY